MRTALFAALDAGNHAIALFDPCDRLAYSNEAFRQGWAVDLKEDVTFEDIIRHCHAAKKGAIVATDDIEHWLRNAQKSRRYGPAERSFEVDLWDGRWMWLTETRSADGWLLTLAQDITALKRSERMLKVAHDAAVVASLTDPLTNLPNRRQAIQVLEAYVAERRPFHLAIVDVDNFKLINDRHGHATGDAALQLLSVELAGLDREHGFVARLAGDEFLLAMSCCTAQEFEARLRQLVDERSSRCAKNDPPDCFSISIGAASHPDHASSLPELLKAADAAMYRAKAQGKCTLQFGQSVGRQVSE